MNRTRISLAAPFLLLTFLGSCSGGGGSDGANGSRLPDVSYAYSTDPNAPLPEGASLIGEAEFARLYGEGKLFLDGPKARQETQDREENHDQEDLALIDAYQKANPLAPPMLPEQIPVTDGSVEPTGDGNFRLTRQGGVVTLGQRFRTRAVANSIRQFNTRENQLAIYQRYIEGLPPAVVSRLALKPLSEVSNLTVAEIRDINFTIASNWQAIITYINIPPTGPVLPASCDDDMNAGSGEDHTFNSWDNAAYCGNYRSNGLMLNYDWPGKEHISCVKNQRYRGTCPSFSSASAMEYRVHEQYGLRANLSEQALYARMKLVWGDGQHFVDGYTVVGGFNSSYAERFVLPFENQWNYNTSWMRRIVNDSYYEKSCYAYTETCSNTTHQTRYMCTEVWDAWHVMKETYCGYSYPDVNPGNQGYRVTGGTVNYWDPANPDFSLAQMIIAVGVFRQPVMWGFDVEISSFDPDADGFVHYWGKVNMEEGAHVVHVVGMITNARLAEILPNAPTLMNGGGYFIVKNSWGKCWGDGGFAYIPFASVLNYTLDASTAPHVAPY